MLLMLILPVASLFVQNFNLHESDGEYEIYSTANATYISGTFKNEAKNAIEAKNVAGEVGARFGIKDVNKQLYYKQTIELVYGRTYQFYQLHEGFFVYGKTLSITVDREGKVLSVTGNANGNIDLKIQTDLLEPNLKDVLGEFEPYNILKTEMVVYEKEKEFFFCYNLTLSSTSHYSCFIDAYTGDLIDAVPLTNNLSTLPSSGYTITPEEVDQKDALNNNISVIMEKYVSSSGSDTFYLLADSSKNIYMADNKNKTSYSGYDYYTSTTGKITDSVAVTAYINLITAYDFYKDYLSVEGISDGNDGKITLTALVHYDTNMKNAAYVYTYSSSSHYFIFGDGGDVYKTDPVTQEKEYLYTYNNFALGLDVVGHEYTHAMTRSIVDFKYLNESGALSEAYSDMFGAMIEAVKNNYTFEDSKFWAIGEDLLEEDGRCVRNLKNPKVTSYANKVADCLWNHDHDDAGCDRGGVHSNCQIFTYAIYKMYEADVFSDINSMATLLYSSLPYLTTTATLLDSRAALLLAAEHLKLGDETKVSIMNSFAAVGLGKESRSCLFYEDETMTGEPIAVSDEIGATIEIPACSFEKEGKVFWYWTNAKGEVLEAGKSFTMGSENLSFYAVWSENELSVLEGDGNDLSPYLIEDYFDLKTVGYYVNQNAYEGQYNSACYEIVADIDMSNDLWIPIGTKENPFNGSFDGGKYKINNINLNADSSREYNGLFGYLGSGAYIFNIVISDVDIITQAKYTGAVAGFSNGTITKCTNNANIQSTDIAGGIIGLAETTGSTIIEDCINRGEISANTAGGIIGHAYSSMASADSDVYYSGYVVNSYNTATICGAFAGGICGQANGVYFLNCINNGFINAVSGIAGGICGIITLQDMINSPLANPAIMVYGGIFSAKVSADVEATTKGALVGKVECINQSGVIYLENNTIKSTYTLVGNFKVFTSNESAVVKFINNKTTNDNAFDGDFDYDNLEFYIAAEKWTVLNGYTPYNFIFTWQIVENDMPTFVVMENWFGVGYDYITSLSRYESPFDGYGTSSNPYKIKNAKQLAALSVYVANGYNFAGQYFKLTADIDLNGKAWVGIGIMNRAATDWYCGFSGTFDGNGYVIENLTGSTLGSVVEDQDYIVGYRTQIFFGSLFGITAPYFYEYEGKAYSYYPTIKNVIIRNSNVSGVYSAGFVGLALSSLNIENCYNINGTITSSGFAGGIVGYLGSNDFDISYTGVEDQIATIKNCYTNATISGTIAGGLIGYAENTSDSLKMTLNLINCVNVGNVFGVGVDLNAENAYSSSSVGGIMGSSIAAITNFENCIFGGIVKSYTAYGAVGGILGTLGHKSYGQSSLTMSFVGCKVYGELLNLVDNDSLRVGALIGSSAGEEIATVNISNINKTHYLTKYVPFGRNVVGNQLTICEYEGADDNAYNFNDLNYFKSDKLSQTYQFSEEIMDKLRTKYTVVYKDENVIFDIQSYISGTTFNSNPKKYNPFKSSDFFYDYRFVGWDYSGDVLSDLEVHALYEKTIKPQGIVLLIAILLICFLVPIMIVVRNHFKKKEHR